MVRDGRCIGVASVLRASVATTRGSGSKSGLIGVRALLRLAPRLALRRSSLAHTLARTSKRVTMQILERVDIPAEPLELLRELSTLIVDHSLMTVRDHLLRPVFEWDAKLITVRPLVERVFNRADAPNRKPGISSRAICGCGLSACRTRSRFLFGR